MTNFKYAKKDKLITSQVFKNMLKSAEKAWVKSLLVYLYLYGVRITEAIRINLEDLTIESFNNVEYLIANSPTLKNRKVHNRRIYMPLNTVYLPILLGYMDGHKGGRLWPYSRVWAWKHVTALNPEVSPHVFRHNRLTRFAQDEATAFQIQSFAGHSDLRPASSYIQTSGVITRKLVEGRIIR